MIVNDHKEVTAVCILHDDAQTAGVVLEEGLFVANDVRMAHRGQDADLIECVLFLLRGEFSHLNFLHGVDGPVRLALDAEHITEGTLAFENKNKVSEFVRNFSRQALSHLALCS